MCSQSSRAATASSEHTFIAFSHTRFPCSFCSSHSEPRTSHLAPRTSHLFGSHSCVQYSWRMLVTPLDRCIESFVLRGAMQMARFLEGRGNNDTDAGGSGLGGSIVWVEQARREELEEVAKSTRTWKRVRAVALMAVAGLAFLRVSGLSWLATVLSRQRAAAGGIGGMPGGGGGAAVAIASLAGSLGGGVSFSFSVAWAMIVRVFRKGGLLL